MTSVVSGEIGGVLLVTPRVHSDERGSLRETYRQEWLGPVPAMVQGTRSESKAGVIRALHYHLRQADYWYVPRGRIFVAMYDLRRSSPTRGKRMTLEIGEDSDIGVYIPPGVAHGFQAVTDALLTYLVDQYYDASDEQGLAWDDPDAAIPWPLADPILSDRDKQNPKLADIASSDLPD